MAAGSRRFLVTIQQSTPADDGAGQQIEGWGTYITRWASVVATGGTERYKGRQIMPDMTHVLEVVSDSETRAITPGMRAVWRDRYINFEIVTPMDGRIRMIQIQGKEYVQT